MVSAAVGLDLKRERERERERLTEGRERRGEKDDIVYINFDNIIIILRGHSPKLISSLQVEIYCLHYR